MLIELCVAMAMTALVIGIVFGVWGNISKHMIERQRKNMLYSEANQLCSRIASQLRRSPGVLTWQANSISFITPDSTDTISYEFSYNELKKNDTLIAIVSQNAMIRDFAIEEVEASGEKSDMKLLSLSLSIADKFSNDYTASNAVAVRVLAPAKEKSDRNDWNF
jgi:hypothetical protein